MSDHGPMSRIAAAVTGLLTGLTAVVVLASPAAAHARLLDSTPKDDSTVTKTVTEIRLRFTEPVKQSLTTVRVTGPEGAAHSDGGPRVVDATITQKVSALPTGVVKVGWRTVSVDGHTIQGSFTFTNRAAPATPSPTASASPAPSPAATSSESPAAAPVDAAQVDAQSASAGTEAPRRGWVGGVAAVVAILLLAGAGLWWQRRRTLR